MGGGQRLNQKKRKGGREMGKLCNRGKFGEDRAGKKVEMQRNSRERKLGLEERENGTGM